MPKPKKVKKLAAPASEYQVQQENILPSLDPHLQDVVMRQRGGQAQSAAFVTESVVGDEFVDVVAKLKDPAAAVPGLTVVRTIGDIVTAAVKVSDVEAVRTHPNVVSLKRAAPVGKMLRFSVPEMEASAAALQQAAGPAHPTLDGSGVIVGVVDFGIDPLHGNFRRADGTSRLLFLWDQNGPRSSMTPAGFAFGREMTQSQITAASGQPDPYLALGYEPADGSHGTHVADIAAGNGAATATPGVAPGADLIFVELRANDGSGNESFGNSRSLLEAVDYIFEKAGQLGRPCVVNLSLGTHGGPHDGSTPVEQGFEALLRTPGRAIVVAAGNAFQHQGHASGVLGAGQSRTLTWAIQSFDATPNELEVWYGSGASLQLTLIDPAGVTVATVAPGTAITINHASGPGGRIISRQSDPNNGASQIDIILNPNLRRGQWKVQLTNPGAAPVPFDAWIERDATAGTQSFFAPADVDPARTLGSICCGPSTLAVGAYDHRVVARDISAFSSAGPTRDGRQKPEVSAPGQDIRAARARTQSTKVESGTSMAAPHVTGLIALVLQAAGRALTCAEIRALVMNAARNSPPAAGQWDSRYGVGRVSAARAIPGSPAATGPAVTAPLRVMTATAGGPASTPLDGWLSQMVQAAERSNAKVTVHIEVEPRS